MFRNFISVKDTKRIQREPKHNSENQRSLKIETKNSLQKKEILKKKVSNIKLYQSIR